MIGSAIPDPVLVFASNAENGFVDRFQNLKRTDDYPSFFIILPPPDFKSGRALEGEVLY
jgi:hypothetical protein